MSSQLFESLEGRVLLSCLPEPVFEDGHWHVWGESFGSGAGGERMFPAEAYYERWLEQRAAGNIGRLDATPSAGFLAGLLDHDSASFGWDDYDYASGSLYSLFTLTATESDGMFEIDVGVYDGTKGEQGWTFRDGTQHFYRFNNTSEMHWRFVIGDFTRGEQRFSFDNLVEYSASGSHFVEGDDKGGDPDNGGNGEYFLEDYSWDTASQDSVPWVTGGTLKPSDTLDGVIVGERVDFGVTVLDIPNGPNSLHMPIGNQVLFCYDPAVPPMVDKITSLGRSGDTDNDGMIDWMGRYIGGVEHDEVVEVTFADGTPQEVRFELVSSEHTQVVSDTTSSDGWSFSPAIHKLTKDAVIEVTINPNSSQPIRHTIELQVDAPGFFADYIGTWYPATDTYRLVSEGSFIRDEGGLTYNLGDQLRDDLDPDLASALDIDSWTIGLDVVQREVVSVSMDPAIKPLVSELSLTPMIVGFGGTTLVEQAVIAPDPGRGEWGFSLSATPPSQYQFSKLFKWSVTLSGMLRWDQSRSFEARLLSGWVDKDIKITARIAMPFNAPYFGPAPILSTGLGVYGRFGFMADLSISAIFKERATPDANGYRVDDYGVDVAVEARGTPSLSAVVAPIGGHAVADKANVGVRGALVFSLKKSWVREFGEPHHSWTYAHTVKGRISVVAKLWNWSWSAILFEADFSGDRPRNSGPDPVIESILVDGQRPTLVTLELPTFESTPRVVTQTWTGSAWSDGTIFADDGHAKFGLAAAALGDDIVFVYSGTQRPHSEFERWDINSVLLDTELYWSRAGSSPERLTNDSTGDDSPALAFTADGSSGVLAWIRETGTIDTLTTQIIARLWTGDGFGETIELSAAGQVIDPKAIALDDGRLAVTWRDDQGRVHTRFYDDESWSAPATLDGIHGAYQALQVGGQLHIIAVVDSWSPALQTLKLYTHDSGWTLRGELATLVQSILSVDAKPDGQGNLVVGLTSLTGADYAVYSALLDLDDLAADRWVRADGGVWKPDDVSVLPGENGRYHLAYGLFPTSLDQTEPPDAEIRRAPGSRLASGVHLIDGTPTRESRVGGISGVNGSLNVIAINENGAFVYERSNDINGEGNVIDLGVPDAFAADTWTKGGSARYVILSAGKVRVWIDGGLTDLTDTLAGEAIAEHLTVFTARDGRVFLAGMTDSGELVAYIEQGGEWTYRNITVEDLDPQGLETPVFAGKVANYVTTWNGLTIAGIDAAGDIRAIWWAPGLETWTVSNLSDITGAPRSVGNLAVTLTGWGGINLAATTIDGRLRVTWWVPSFGGKWVVSDLTQNADGVGLQLRPETTFGYTTPWGALNFGGLDHTGELVVFWWTPSRSTWTPAELTQPGAIPVSDLRAFVSESGETSIVGENSESEIVRYWWVADGTGWDTEIVPV